LLAGHLTETEILASQLGMMARDLPEASSDTRRDSRAPKGTFAPVIPISIPYRRARSWAARMRAGRLDAKRLELMLAMERKNLG
jgi:hypothetical protein